MRCWQRSILSVVSMAALLAGCASANRTSVFRQFSSQQTSVLIDAKQRAILSAPARGDDPLQPRLTCAEPSPDVFSAIAASFGATGEFKLTPGSAGTTEGKAEVASRLAESAAQLSRGATIQLLRDGLYRACEAYMNGAVDRAEYIALVNKYSDAAVAFLAIEGLTGMDRKTAVTIESPILPETDEDDKSKNTPPEGESQSTGPGESDSRVASAEGPARVWKDGDSYAGSRYLRGTLINGPGPGEGGAAAPRPVVSQEIAGAVKEITTAYFNQTVALRDNLKEDKCLGYFDRSLRDISPEIAKGLNEEQLQYYRTTSVRRKGLLLILCVDKFPALQPLFAQPGLREAVPLAILEELFEESVISPQTYEILMKQAMQGAQ